MNKIRVIQYGVGPIGAGIVRLMLQKPELEIVGAIDVDPQKAGKDLGTVVGAKGPIGVKISADSQAVLRAGADVVVHTTSSYLTSVSSQLVECLKAHTHVVSTCEVYSPMWGVLPRAVQLLDPYAQADQRPVDVCVVAGLIVDVGDGRGDYRERFGVLMSARVVLQAFLNPTYSFLGFFHFLFLLGASWNGRPLKDTKARNPKIWQIGPSKADPAISKLLNLG